MKILLISVADNAQLVIETGVALPAIDESAQSILTEFNTPEAPPVIVIIVTLSVGSLKAVSALPLITPVQSIETVGNVTVLRAERTKLDVTNPFNVVSAGNALGNVIEVTKVSVLKAFASVVKAFIEAGKTIVAKA